MRRRTTGTYSLLNTLHSEFFFYFVLEIIAVDRFRGINYKHIYIYMHRSTQKFDKRTDVVGNKKYDIFVLKSKCKSANYLCEKTRSFSYFDKGRKQKFYPPYHDFLWMIEKSKI